MDSILYIIENISNLGGIEKITSLIANDLSLNYKIYILNINNTGNHEPKYKLNKEIAVLNLKKENKILKLIETIKIVRKLKIDFVIIQAKNLYYFTFLKHFISSKIIFVDHDSAKAYPETQINENKPRKIASKKADIIVSLTEENKNEYIKRFHTKENKIVVIPNFIDIKKEPVLYNENSKTIVAVGRYHQQKRFDLLIESFSLIADDYPEWNLNIYGEGQLRHSLQELINSKKLENRISLCGEYANKEEAYLDKAFLCMTSQHEGFGLVLLEGFTYKLPAIAFNCHSGPSEIIVDGKNGYLIDYNDVFSFSEAMRKLIENDSLRLSFSKHASESLKKFNKENIINMWKDILD